MFQSEIFHRSSVQLQHTLAAVALKFHVFQTWKENPAQTDVSSPIPTSFFSPLPILGVERPTGNDDVTESNTPSGRFVKQEWSPVC